MKNPIIPGLNLPVRSVYCIGRNYQEHAKEMKSAVPREPMVFLKNLSAICFEEEAIQIPPQSRDVHHEGELVIAIGKEGKNISAEDAGSFISGYGLGIDFTARDLQQQAKDRRHPWSLSKGFDTFAPIGQFLNPDQVHPEEGLNLTLKVNGETRQNGNTSDMIFPVNTLIAYLSEHFTLYPGDLIFTGTPSGVGPVQSGDQIDVNLEDGLLSLTVTIA